MNTKNFGMAAVSATTPATQRIMVSRKVDGSLDIQTTEDEDSAIKLLDEAMEAIDGQRLPPQVG